MFSITVNEAMCFRKKGCHGESVQLVTLAYELCGLLVEDLNSILCGMEEHCKEYRTTPSVEPLQTEFFRSRRARNLARQNRLLDRIPQSRPAKFLGKLRFLRKIVADVSADVGNVASGLRDSGTTDSAEPEWAMLDAAHYDLTTCLRELLVMLKCYLRILSTEDLAVFHTTIGSFKHPLGRAVPS
jgi:hypothetical protein